MKPIKKSSIICFVILSLAFTNAYSQTKAVIVNDNHMAKKVVVVKNNRHHLFRRSAVYHPHWAPRMSYHSRWVYFPRYNFYWDNYSNVYVVKTGTVWITYKTSPKELENVDLSKEKSTELSKENDSKDSIQDQNAEHQRVYRVN